MLPKRIVEALLVVFVQLAWLLGDLGGAVKKSKLTLRNAPFPSHDSLPPLFRMLLHILVFLAKLTTNLSSPSLSLYHTVEKDFSIVIIRSFVVAISEWSRGKRDVKGLRRRCACRAPDLF